MRRRLRGLLLIAAALVVVGAPGAEGKAPPPVAAKGLPFGAGAAGPEGTTPPGADNRFVALPAGGGTVVAEVSPIDQTIARSTFLPGDFTVQAVTMDRDTAGISADGGTLVLIQPRAGFFRRTTKLAILDARRLSLRRVVTLRGNFDLDAVSPTGRYVYLVQYTNPADPTDYLIRAYDLHAGRMLSKPVVDPKDRGETMTGYPLTRVTSPDGRWAYTLYSGGRGAPFVHALDTARHTAVCVELDALGLSRDTRDLSNADLALSADGRRLAILDGTAVPQPRPQGVVDTRTFKVTPAPAPATTPSASERSDRGTDWLPIVAIVLVLTATVGLTVRHRRRPAST